MTEGITDHVNDGVINNQGKIALSVNTRRLSVGLVKLVIEFERAYTVGFSVYIRTYRVWCNGTACGAPRQDLHFDVSSIYEISSNTLPQELRAFL